MFSNPVFTQILTIQVLGFVQTWIDPVFLCITPSDGNFIEKEEKVSATTWASKHYAESPKSRYFILFLCRYHFFWFRYCHRWCMRCRHWRGNWGGRHRGPLLLSLRCESIISSNVIFFLKERYQNHQHNEVCKITGLLRSREGSLFKNPKACF